MKNRVSAFLDVWKSNYSFKTFFSSAVSSVLGIVFAAYNGFLGIYYASLWNGTIGLYYILLAIIRFTVVISQRKSEKMQSDTRKAHRKKTFITTHIIIIFMNLSLIGPISLMISGNRTYNLGLIPAIAMAAYTTYRIVMAAIHFRKSKTSDNMLVKELRMLNMIDTFVAVLTLQNTMIIANVGGIDGEMKLVSIITSSVIWLGIVILSIVSFFKIKQKRALDNE